MCFIYLFVHRLRVKSRLSKLSFIIIPKQQIALIMLAKFLQSTFNYTTQKQPEPNQEVNSQLLPGDLAGKILNLQIECEGYHISKEILGELIDLYRSAIEYYEAINCEKYKIYKKRLQTFISKPSIAQKLGGKDATLIEKKEMVERNRLHAIVNTKEEIAKIIDKSNKRADSNQKLVAREMRTQQEQLEARIERRKSMSNKSTRTDNEDFEEEVGKKKQLKQETMNMNLLLNGIKGRNVKRVFI